MNAVHVDYQGDLSGIDLDLDYARVDDDIRERLECRKYVQIRLTPITYLVVPDTSSRFDTTPVNPHLTVLASKFGHEEPVHGEGIVVGHDLEGEICPIVDLELRMLVLTYTGRLELATTR